MQSFCEGKTNIPIDHTDPIIENDVPVFRLELGDAKPMENTQSTPPPATSGAARSTLLL